MQDFNKLAVWQKAHDLSVNIFRLTGTIPRQGNAGFVSQLRRSAEAIPSNIAEGCGRGSDTDFAKFIQIAIGSASELESHLKFANDAGLVPRPIVETTVKDVIEVRRMLIGLQKKLDPSRFKQLTVKSL
jgi:four helix bundle protein